MPLLLHIETATDICSIGISEDSELLALVESAEKYEHVSQITILINRCLKQANTSLAQIDGIVVSSGPGSYTALRVGTATAKGICYALDKPLLAVDTLKSIAYASMDDTLKKVLYCPMIDARRMEVYTTVFDAQLEVVKLTEALILTPNTFDAFIEAGHTIVISGNGAEKCQTIIQNPAIIYKNVVCSAAHFPFLAKTQFLDAQFEDIAYYTPLYFKPPNITSPKKHL